MPDEQDGHKTGDAPKRKGISKKTRFEVFKRDSFACTYCGRAAPTVVLHVDHIKPVSEGGLNDIFNLTTACEDCNAGKGPRELSDQSTLAKQKASLDELNERRLQLEMMMEWREGLANVEAQQIEAVKNAIASHTAGERIVSEHGALHIKKWLKKFTLAEVLEAVDSAFSAHLELGASDRVMQQSWNKAFDAVPQFVSFNKSAREKPWLKDALYIRGILRVRHENGDLDEYYYGDALELIEAALQLNASVESMKALAKTTTVWGAFVGAVERFCTAQRAKGATPPPPIVQQAQARADEEEDRGQDYDERVDEERAEARRQNQAPGKPSFDWAEFDDPDPRFPELRDPKKRDYED